MLSEPSLTLRQQASRLPIKKQLSQSFLVDPAILQALLSAVQQVGKPQESNCQPIMEIGCGAGFLTQALLEAGYAVLGIEVDADMIGVLQKRFGQEPRFSLRHESILKTPIEDLLPYQGLIIGNLPYHLTGPILFRLIGELDQIEVPLRQQVKAIFIMVQKEVGERLWAKPNTGKAYGQLSLQAQMWFDIQPVITVPRQAFYPVPKVDSVIVCLTPRPRAAVEVTNLVELGRLIKAGFQHRRKTLLNSLKQVPAFSGLHAQLPEAITSVGIAPGARAETIALEKFAELSNVLTALK